MDALKEKHVLVVDDDEAIRMFLSYFFKEKGMFVTEAGDGDEAIEKALYHEFDLITMDLVMPNVTGIDAIRAIRTVDPKQRIIIISSCYMTPVMDEVNQLNITHFIQKPIALNLLEEAVLDEMSHEVELVDPWVKQVH